jgi:glycosyltransferase involved in cell wall biosynthesis
MASPKVSVVIRCRNEYPIILCTMNALLEDLEACGLEGEVIAVSNRSTDSLPDILRDRYRRWISAGVDRKGSPICAGLKVVEYEKKGSQACSINAGWGAAVGDVLVVADAHISVRPGTLGHLVRGAWENGGVWHPAYQMWGDDLRTRLYGFDLSLDRNFWGGLCRHVPRGCRPDRPWPIAMAGGCLYAVSRETVGKLGGLYSDAFRSYGGIEPYLGLKAWRVGSSVMLEPRGLCRHAFGLRASWKKVTRPTTKRNEVLRKGGGFTRQLAEGEEYLSYSSGYSSPPEEYLFNSLLSAYVVGNTEWQDRVAASFSEKGRGEEVRRLAEEARQEGDRDAADLSARATRTLDDLLRNPPWAVCEAHGGWLGGGRPEFLK